MDSLLVTIVNSPTNTLCLPFTAQSQKGYSDSSGSNSSPGGAGVAVVTFASSESALPAVNALKGLEFKGNKLGGWWSKSGRGFVWGYAGGDL